MFNSQHATFRNVSVPHALKTCPLLPIPASMMESATSSTQSSFFSLPRELRDQIYGYLLVDHDRPIFFDAVNSFMPMAEYLQDGILATLCKAIPSMAVEVLAIFYKHNHFIIKCVDIPWLTNFAPYQITIAPLPYPRSYVMHLTVLVDCVELSHSSLELLLIWDRLRTAIIEIRGSYKAVKELCGKVIDIATTCDLLKKKLGPGLMVVVVGQPSLEGNKYVHTRQISADCGRRQRRWSGIGRSVPGETTYGGTLHSGVI